MFLLNLPCMFGFLQRLYATPGFEPEKTFDLVTKVLKKCNENADVVYLV